MTATPLLAAAATGLMACAAVCAAAARRLTRARRRRPSALEDGALQVSFPARDGRARVDGWYLPAPAGRPAVVFVHGKDDRRRDERPAPRFGLARMLAAAGFAVLIIDRRGHGAGSRARTTGGGRERFDVLGAIDWLRGRGHRVRRTA